jgi:hypothetical protein
MESPVGSGHREIGSSDHLKTLPLMHDADTDKKNQKAYLISAISIYQR